MSFTLLIHEAVFNELKETAEYYETLQMDLSFRLLNDWDNTLNAIIKTPFGFQKKFKDFRCIQLMYFPYIIVYKIDKEDIIIYRFINMKKKPEKRFKRRG